MKIVDKYEILKRYNLKNKNALNYRINKIKKIIKKSTGLNVIDNKNYLFLPYKVDDNIPKLIIETREVREKMIEILLLLNRESYTVYKLKEILGYEKDEKCRINNELKRVLEKFGISYKEYIYTKDKINYLNNNIINIKTKRKEILKEILLKRWERVYKGKAVYFEMYIIELICDALKVTNINKIYEEILENKDITITEIYDIFVEKLLNLKNKKRIRKINYEVKYEINENNEFYEIKEETIKYNNEEYKTKKIVKTNKKVHKINTLLILDVLNERKVLKLYNYLIGKLNVIKICNYKENIINEHINENYEQIVLISESDIRNNVVNKGDKPIFFIQTNNDKRKALEESIKIFESMEKYNEIIKRV